MITPQDKTVYEFVEKKSRFIAVILPVKNEADFQQQLKNLQDEWKSATHYCYAYRIIQENRMIHERKNDDGEPSGTAGAPILAVLNGGQWINTAVVVIRYFGGIKLGTGGLVSAYKKSASEALKKTSSRAFIIEKEAVFEIPVSQVSSLEYFLRRENFMITERDFGESVRIKVRFPEDRRDKLTEIAEQVQGKLLG
jgi:uncharacterized YigZ family protein